MTNPTQMSCLGNTPLNFRVFFALQHVVLLEKSRISQGQIFARLDIPTELRLRGRFSLFVSLLSSLIRQGLASYPAASANRLVFVTADYASRQLTLRITDGGSGLRYQNRLHLNDSTVTSVSLFKSLSQLEKLINTNFSGQIEIHNFTKRGTQVTIKLPAPTDSQILDKF